MENKGLLKQPSCPFEFEIPLISGKKLNKKQRFYTGTGQCFLVEYSREDLIGDEAARTLGRATEALEGVLLAVIKDVSLLGRLFAVEVIAFIADYQFPQVM